MLLQEFGMEEQKFGMEIIVLILGPGVPVDSEGMQAAHP